MYFKRVASLVIISVLLLSILSPIAYASVIYGPESYYRTTGSPNKYSDSFSISDLRGNYTLYVKNGDLICNGSGSHNASTSSVVTFNGEEVFRPDDFKNSDDILKKTVIAGAQNDLNVEMRGKPGSNINVWLEDETPDIQILSPWDDTA